jgi:hypothetical protein
VKWNVGIFEKMARSARDRAVCLQRERFDERRKGGRWRGRDGE